MTFTLSIMPGMEIRKPTEDYNNWNHRIIPHWIDSTWNNAGSYPGGDDIGANFYPQLACYSSNNPELITRHMKQIRRAGIGVVVFSWWGKDSFSDKSVKKLSRYSS